MGAEPPLLRAGEPWLWPDGTPVEVESCDVYWGSHGCYKQRWHRFGHRCADDCCRCRAGIVGHVVRYAVWRLSGGRWFVGCVGRWPYYGRKTSFYGADA